MLENYKNLNSLLKLDKYPSPLQKIVFHNENVFLKRDDMLDLGCSKQRSIPLMISNYLEKGHRKFCISSSGNAALVAAYTAMKFSQIQLLKIYLSKNISEYKISKFIKFLQLQITPEQFKQDFKLKNIEFILSEKPKQDAFALQKDGFINLRGSTEDIGIVGFKSLGYEISDQCNDTDAVFVPASSGSTAIGIYEALKEKGIIPQFHIIQTTRVFTLIKKITERNFDIEPNHPSEAISDIIGHRRMQVENLIKDSNGKGWIISSDEVRTAKKTLLEKFNIDISYDSALSFAAYCKAQEIFSFKKPVIVFTG